MGRDLVYAADMLVATRKVAAFIRDVSEKEFLENELVQSAVLHQFTILGEVAKRLSDDFKAAHPAVEWAKIAGLRNRIVHEYDDVSLDKVWESATGEIQGLIAALEVIVPKEPDGEE
jgi:uncharacterized protein with HEPN domain